jgi:hypothetical protein
MARRYFCTECGTPTRRKNKRCDYHDGMTWDGRDDDGNRLAMFFAPSW